MIRHNRRHQDRNLRHPLFSGQASIEFTVAFVAVVILFVGIVKVWAWMVNSLVWRQQAYDATRHRAATFDEAGTINAQGQLTYYTDWASAHRLSTCLSVLGEANVGAQVNGACQ